MKKFIPFWVCLILTAYAWTLKGQVAPNLGTAVTYGLFGGGTMSSTDSIYVDGDIGYNSYGSNYVKVSGATCNSSCTGYSQLLTDVNSAAAQCSSQSGTVVTSASLTNATLTAGVYQVNGDLDLNGTLVLNGGDTSVYIFNISGAMTIGSGFMIQVGDLTPSNVVFNVTGNVTANLSSYLDGVILCGGNTEINEGFGGRHTLLSVGGINTTGKNQFTSSLLNGVNFSKIYIGKACGLKYVQASVKMNQRQNIVQPPGISTVAGSQQPITLSVTVPVNAAIDKAFIWYTDVTWGASSLSHTGIQLTDPSGTPHPFTSTRIGSNTASPICWDFGNFLFNQTSSYRIDVTNAIVAGTGSTQNYILSGLPNPTSSIDHNGVTMMVIYKDVNGPQEEGTLLIYDGLFVQTGSAPAFTTIQNGLFAPGTQIVTSKGSAFMCIADIEVPFNTMGTGIPPYFVFNQTPINSLSPPVAQRMWTYHSLQTSFLPTQTALNFIHQKPNSDCYALTVVGAYYTKQTLACNSSAIAGSDQTICATTLPVTTTLSTTATGASYQWSPTTGLTNPTAATTTLTTSASSTTYTLTVTQANGTTATDQVIVNVSQNPPPPVINGNTDGCDIYNTYYNLTGYIPGYNYSFTISTDNGTVAGYGTQLYINNYTLNLTNGATITWTVTHPATGCKSQSTLVIQPCCPQAIKLPFINVTSITNAANSSYWNLFYPYNGTVPVLEPGTSTYTLNPSVNFPANPVVKFPTSFTVDANFTIKNAEVVMLPNASIYVNAERNLFINNSTVRNCSAMWNFIQLSPRAGIWVENNSHIAGADKAVYAQATSKFTISNSFFEKNNVSLYLFGGDYSTSSVTNTQFTCAGTLPPPNATQKSNKHIEMLYVTAFTLGDGSALNKRNFFDNAVYGIYALQSNFTLRNNKFTNITPVSGSSAYCVYADGGMGSATYTMSIGDAASYRYNLFETSSNGIYVTGKQGGTINGNYFTNMAAAANDVSFFNCNGISMTCFYNKLNGFGTGFYLRDNKGCTITITNNEFNLLAGYVGTYGIRANNTTLPNPANTLDINRNTMANIARTFIGVLNENRVRVGPFNTITFAAAPPGNDVRYGIQIQNGSGHLVNENTFTRSGVNPNNVFETKRFAISIETASNSTVTNNIIEKLGSGIRFYNAGTNTVTCNSMTYNFVGVRLENSPIGNQGSAGAAQDNRWYDSPVFDKDIKQVGTTYNAWWYASSAQLPFTPSSFNCLPQNFITFPPSQPNQNCYTPCSGCRQRQLAAIVNEEGDYGLLPEEEKYNLKREVFEQLMNDPELMNQGTADDIILQLFYNNALNDNMGQLINAENILLNDTLGLNAFLSMFNPENNAEQNMQIVLEIYEATYGMEPEDFTADQVDNLLAIALQSPISGGEAVYIARGMLHLDVDDLIDENNQRKSSIAKNDIEQIYVYPNPSNEDFTVELNIKEDETAVIFIKDLFGKVILIKDVTRKDQRIVETTATRAGVYFYEIVVDGILKANGKLVVIH